MTRRPPVLCLALLLGAVAALPAVSAEVPTPESVLGFKVGEDRKLADWTQIVDYFQKLAAASPRVKVENVGATTEGNPFLVVTITSEANMARLEEIRRANLRLADPRTLSEDEARRLIDNGKAIVALNHGIHSTEVGASQTSMETAYALASAQDRYTLDILDKTVILMLPSHNPDGTQKVVDWYRKSLGTPWEGGQIPFLYHKYTGHDNNRDWYMFTQVETQLTVKHLYDRWRPQVVHDLHQMGARTARIFAPPYVDPWEPNVDPALIEAVNGIGTHIGAGLTTEGKKGVVIHALYDAWTPARAYPHTHGGVRILTECASAKMATPIDVKFKDLEAGIGYDAKQASWNFPDPWPGGGWRLRDIVDYQLSATRALLEHAARHRDYWLRTSYAVNRRGSLRREPYAFIVPAVQRDPLATSKLLWVLRTGAVEVYRARAEFKAGDRTYPAGSYVILMSQPFSAFAKMLLERQRYPDLRQWPGGPPQRPYDVTAHTLPLLMGVEVVTSDAPFVAALEKIDAALVAPGRIERGHGRFFALGHKNAELVALGRLLRAGVPTRWATAAFLDRGQNFRPGTLLVPENARARLEPMARELGFVAAPVNADAPSLLLRKPRVGIYQSYVPSIDEGWTRFVFEKQLGVDYETLHDKDVRAGGLRAHFDAIVLPAQSRRAMVGGNPPGAMPPEYVGGLGKEGVQSLKTFVEQGGTLVALDAASEMPITDFALPVTNVLAAFHRDEGDQGSKDFYCPGAILAVQVEGTSTSPLAHGMDATTPVWFEGSPAFETKGGTVVARYPSENPLLSGWLLGEKYLYGKGALVEVPLGTGRVVLFGFRPQYRAQSWATYIALLNALYTSAATPLAP
jgi:hypothetical protein